MLRIYFIVFFGRLGFYHVSTLIYLSMCRM